MCSYFKSYLVILIFKVLTLLNKYCLFCHLFVNNYGVTLIIGSYINNIANTALTENRPQSCQRRNPSMLCQLLCVSPYSYRPSLNNYVHLFIKEVKPQNCSCFIKYTLQKEKIFSKNYKSVLNVHISPTSLLNYFHYSKPPKRK